MAERLRRLIKNSALTDRITNTILDKLTDFGTPFSTVLNSQVSLVFHNICGKKLNEENRTVKDFSLTKH